ncbi:uncharacterized protein [Alexandromys fortis]|uniref:uncharacterized protein n=1 Tax=Alexandromys fortis TaxID=100897 RepID=UPI002152CFB4|nr:uncharacterized protein LOC126501499 [Microtus fortis]
MSKGIYKPLNLVRKVTKTARKAKIINLTETHLNFKETTQQSTFVQDSGEELTESSSTRNVIEFKLDDKTSKNLINRSVMSAHKLGSHIYATFCLDQLVPTATPTPHLLRAHGKDAKSDSGEDGVTCQSSSTRLLLEPARVALKSWVPKQLPGPTQGSVENRPIPALARPGDPNWRARTSGNCGSPALRYTSQPTVRKPRPTPNGCGRSSLISFAQSHEPIARGRSPVSACGCGAGSWRPPLWPSCEQSQDPASDCGRTSMPPPGGLSRPSTSPADLLGTTSPAALWEPCYLAAGESDGDGTINISAYLQKMTHPVSF